MKYILTLIIGFCFFGHLSAQESNANQENFLIKSTTVDADVSDLELDKVKYFEGKVYLNGALSNTKEINALKPDNIESVSIFKGEAAKSQFDTDFPVLVVKTKQ